MYKLHLNNNGDLKSTQYCTNFPFEAFQNLSQGDLYVYNKYIMYFPSSGAATKGLLDHVCPLPSALINSLEIADETGFSTVSSLTQCVWVTETNTDL